MPSTRRCSAPGPRSRRPTWPVGASASTTATPTPSRCCSTGWPRPTGARLAASAGGYSASMAPPSEETPDIPPPPGGLPPGDDSEIVDQDALRPDLPPLATDPMSPMPAVPPGPESATPPLASPAAPSEVSYSGLQRDDDHPTSGGA